MQVKKPLNGQNEGISAGDIGTSRALRAKAALIKAEKNERDVISKKKNLKPERDRGKVTY